MIVEGHEPGAAEVSKTFRPSLFFETITFSDGSVIEVAKNDVIVFVGPNNAGKSAALRELEGRVSGLTEGKVIRDVTIRREGTSEDLLRYLRNNS